MQSESSSRHRSSPHSWRPSCNLLKYKARKKSLPRGQPRVGRNPGPHGARELGVAVNGPVRETIWSGLGAVSGEAGAINGAEIDPARPVGPVHRPDGNPLKTDGNGDPAGKGTAPVVEAVSWATTDLTGVTRPDQPMTIAGTEAAVTMMKTGMTRNATGETGTGAERPVGWGDIDDSNELKKVKCVYISTRGPPQYENIFKTPMNNSRDNQYGRFLEIL